MKNLIALFLAVAFPAMALAADNTTTNATGVLSTESKAPSMGTSVYRPGTIIDGSSGSTQKTVTGVGPNINAPGINNSTVLDSNSQITVADRDLTRNITQNLLSRGEFSQSMSQIAVTVLDGRVTLKGTVTSEAEKRSLTEQVEKMVGVDSVDNQLFVQLQ